VSSSEPDPRPKLVRTRRGRLIGGVCSGLGAHFGVDPLLLRIAFVGLTFFGGAGAWLYAAILLLVPEEGASRAPIRMVRASSWRTIAGVVVLVAAAGVLVPVTSHATLGGGWPFGVGVGSVAVLGVLATLLWAALRRRGDPHGRSSADRVLARRLALVTALTAGALLLAAGGAGLAGIDRHAAAWAVIALGCAVILSAFAGARWPVLPALAFALPLAVFSAARVDLHGGLGNRVYRPHTVAQLREGYRLGAGRLEVDLRELAFPPGDTSLRIRLGAGELVVLVPDQVCVATRAAIGGGFVGALDRKSGGLDVNWTNRPSPPARTPRLLIDGRVGLGALFVVDRPLVGSFQPGTYGRNDACRNPLGARQ
jgi:phage shock protein PspC (stress-responsive transcriptional regulator)